MQIARLSVAAQKANMAFLKIGNKMGTMTPQPNEMTGIARAMLARERSMWAGARRQW
jgi:hypothetical protein